MEKCKNEDFDNFEINDSESIQEIQQKIQKCYNNYLSVDFQIEKVKNLNIKKTLN